MKPSQILRQTKVKQCVEDYNEAPSTFCALGAIAHGVGWKGYFKKDGTSRKRVGDIESILDKLGLADSIQSRIIELNDEEHKTFKEIADFLEKKGL